MSAAVEYLYSFDGKVFEPVRVGDHDGCYREDRACCGCGEAWGTAHDPGCDWEPCPRCGGQMIACDCDRQEWPGYSADEMREMVALVQAVLTQPRPTTPETRHAE